MTSRAGASAERTLLSVMMEPYVNGVSTRKRQRMLTELGLEGRDKAQVSRINRGLGRGVDVFLERPLKSRYPYLWLDAHLA